MRSAPPARRSCSGRCATARTRVAVAVALILAGSAAAESPAPDARDLARMLAGWTVFDATRGSGTPDLTAVAAKPLEIISEKQLWGRAWDADHVPQGLPDASTIAALAAVAAAQGEPVVLDVENWPVKNAFYSSDPAIFQKALDGFVWILAEFRKTAPTLSLGYFGPPPLDARAYNLRGLNEEDLARWRDYNARLQRLTDAVDALYPELYAWDPPGEWAECAARTIAKARAISNGRPVHAFLWAADPRTGTPLPLDTLRFQLDTLAPLVDGIVFWSDRAPRSSVTPPEPARPR